MGAISAASRPIAKPRFRRPAARGPPALERAPEGSLALSEQIPLRSRGRVPGHQPPSVRNRARHRIRAPQHLRRRGRRPVHLRLARRGHPEDPRLPPRLRGREGGPPRDELSLHPSHPGSRQCRHPDQRVAPRQDTGLGGRRRAAGSRDPARGRDDRGPVRRRRADEARPAGRGEAIRFRRSLPHPDPAAALRSRASGRGDPLRPRRRHVLFRPQGGPRRRRVPQARGEPGGRDRAAAGHQLSAAGDRQDLDRSRPRLRHRARDRGLPGFRARERDRRAGP